MCIRDRLWIDLDDSELRKSLSYRQCMINLYQSWRYLLRPHGINEPDEFIRSYLGFYKKKLPNAERIIRDVSAYFTKRTGVKHPSNS